MSNKPPRPKSTEDILREMEAMSEGTGKSAHAGGGPKGGGAFKSLMDFFVKVVPEEGEDAPPPPPPEFTKPQAQVPRSAVPSAPRPAPRVAELVADEPLPKFNVPTKQGDDLSQRPFEQIYKDAGVTTTPCSVDELATLMENPMVANQPLSVKIIAVNLTLSAKGIGIEVPIADAARRDRALDAYQAMLAQRAQQVEQRNTDKVQQLTKEVEEYLKKKQAEMEALKSEATEAQRQSIDFSVRREAEERRLADLISPFLEGKPNPVTIGNQPGSEPNQG
ncbi:MAG: hypothetical protein HY231_06205 [Acidobacteria bacterium]|nr:hypothetical protein [Acidobacteriota bacterium]